MRSTVALPRRNRAAYGARSGLRRGEGDLRVILDDAQRRGFYARAQQAIAEDVPYVGLWYKTNVAVFHTAYENAQVPISIVPTGGGLAQVLKVLIAAPCSRSARSYCRTIRVYGGTHPSTMMDV